MWRKRHKFPHLPNKSQHNSEFYVFRHSNQVRLLQLHFWQTTRQSRSHGTLQCRSDVTVDSCRSCVQSSVATLPTICPNTKDAFGYFEDCLLYYTNYSAFHVLTDQPQYTLRFDGNVTNMPNFNSTLTKLMYHLKNQASLGDSETKFATGKLNINSNQSLYGLVQCSPDLSMVNCSTCVQRLINNTFSRYFIYVNKKGSLFMAEGGRVVAPSCNIRYELYHFYDNVTYVAQPPTQPPQLPQSSASHTHQDVKSRKSNKAAVIVAPIVGSLVLIIIIIAAIFILLSKRKQGTFSKSFSKEEMEALQSLQFSVGTIKVATDNFADENKLGEGASGTVYKGKLPDGQEIAVKRFERNAILGDAQFKNEILTLAKLHHRNLVRLLGFCLEEEEMLLIYEFVINRSLDNFLFDPMHRASMNWETRYKIINGVARGVLYLHEDSRLRIIHRDLKAANVLLDADFNPKIADFGTAKLFKIDQSQAVTSKVVGTHGYMPPEYLAQGQVSLKSDVFSFGVLVLEIVSGQRISSFRAAETSDNLLTFAWKNWVEGNAWNLVDLVLPSASSAEILRCIHIGLLCVQNNMVDRPTMSSVLLMLSSVSMTLDVPSQPAFFTQNPKLPTTPSQGNATDQSNSSPYSVNGVTITELQPR
ncbi:cysteine-rich receptor-like protein kinase 44 isoform X2 [Amaranthus tricolor]|uniref:cysteine-rich receptor-like protein kinase 44 isoform X2 n=1 Tax=Amaranthus tricolor TaxID=29722 RepID=UPI00258EA1DF|nr:cysteine-rich receptor-like protein kinase 44 isoform X2 [Amaranthus tricolor]